MSKIKATIERSLFRKVINAFIIFFAGLFVFLLLIFGFTQTKTFRLILREQAVIIVNDAINGKLSIGDIRGSVLTSLKIIDADLTVANDTVFAVEKIELKYNPIQLLFDRIKVSKVFLVNPKIKMLQDSTGIWNIEKISKPSEEDTTSSEFPYLIEVSNIELENLNLVRKSYENLNNNDKVDVFNAENLSVKNLNFLADAIVDIKNSEYFLDLKEFNFGINLKKFNLNNFSGIFGITNKALRISNLSFNSDSSNVKINASVDSINLFDDFSIDKLNKSPISLTLNANSFDFCEIATFVDGFNLLKGKADIDLSASGKFGAMYINSLSFSYLKSKINLNGLISNLDKPDKMSFDINVNNSNLLEKDLTKLLTGIDLPNYPELVLDGLNINYVGDIKKFKLKLNAGMNSGKIYIDSNFDLGLKKPKYDIVLNTSSLDLSPINQPKSNINLNGKIQGNGFNIDDLETTVNMTVLNSSFSSFYSDSLKITFDVKDKLFETNLLGTVNNALYSLKGNLNYADPTNPKYSLNGTLNSFDIGKYSSDSTQNSNVNLSFNVDAQNFDIDSLIGKVNIKLEDSEYNYQSIDNSEFNLIMTQDSRKRKIALTSNIMDFSIDGAFSLNDAIDILTYESSTIVGLIQSKVQELNPISESGQTDSVIIALDKSLPEFINKKMKIDFNFSFNDFETIALVMGLDKLDIVGSGSGFVSNDSSNFSINTDINLDYFINVIKEKMVYISGLNTNFKFSRDNQNVSFENLFGSLSITNKRIYTGTEIKNLNADLIFNQSKLIFSASANFNNMIDGELDGKLLMNPNVQTVLLERIWLKYMNEEWENVNDVAVDISPDYIKLKDFQIAHKKTFLYGSGQMLTAGDLDFVFGLKDLDGGLITHYSQGAADPKLKIDLDFETKIKGTLEEPLIESKLSANDIKYDKMNLGNLVCGVNYANSLVKFDVKFLDSQMNYNTPRLVFDGYLPIYLGTKSVESIFLNDKELNIRLISKGFNLNTFGDLLPLVGIRNGILESDVNITGTFEDVKYAGSLKLNDGFFRLKNNNLDYNANIDLQLSKQQIDIKKFIVSNHSGVKFIGSLEGYGKILFDDFNLRKVDTKMHGDLSVLAYASKSVLPIFYGDLYIGTIGEWSFVYENNKAFFTGSVALKETNLVFSPQQNTYTQINSNYNYHFLVDSSKIDFEELNFNRLLSSKNKNNAWGIEKTNTSAFDFSVKVKTMQDAKLVFVLSEATNQKLTVEAVGDINYENKNGESRAQGEFKLLTGSKLEFIKTFDATGAIRFESDVTNPYLNIVATYRGTHITTSGTSEDVAVKLVLEGTVDELGKNLASNPENISVYVGSKNIENQVADQQLGAADAFSFIVIGKFVKDLTVIDQTVLASQADMLLGSVLSSVASNVFGDAINNIQLSQSMGLTKFSVSGKVSNFKYSIGGTTEVFKNVSNANLKVEYLFSPDFSIRLERKEPVVQTFGSEDKINEMGLKYRFQF